MLIRIVLLLAGLAATAHAAVAAATPQRVVSINLCTDELLLTLADPGQIAALSTYAADERLSFLADRAKAFRHDAAEAETVVGLDPDLVLAGKFTKRDTRDMLKRLGFRVVELDPARSIGDSIAAIRQVAELVGHPERGEALVAEIEASRQQAVSAVAARPARPTVVFYQRRGYVTGDKTLTSELLADVGLHNAAGGLTGGSGGFVPLERLVSEPPDFLIVSSAATPAEDQGSALLAHPALLRLFPPEKRIALPDRLTVCGGPSLPAAFDWLAEQAKRIAPP